MPKSEFDQRQKVVGGTIVVSGPFRQHGLADPLAPEPVIHWVIEQRGVLASGMDVHRGGDRWHHSAPAPEEWRDGPARAVGLVVAMTADGAETFAWSQQVDLRRE